MGSSCAYASVISIMCVPLCFQGLSGQGNDDLIMQIDAGGHQGAAIESRGYRGAQESGNEHTF